MTSPAFSCFKRSHLVLLLLSLVALPVGLSSAEDASVVRARSARAQALAAHAPFRPQDELRLSSGTIRTSRDVNTSVLPELDRPRSLVVPRLTAEPLGLRQDVLVQSATDWRTFGPELERLGLEILGRPAPGGWLLRGTSEQLAELRQLPGVSWSTALSPAHKVEERLQHAALSEAAGRSLDPQGRLRVEARFLPGRTALEHEELLGQLDGVEVLALVDDQTSGSVAKLAIEPAALRARLADIAAFRDVGLVLMDELPKTHVDHSTWFLQTGIADLDLDNFDLTAKLFSQGLAGQGLLAGAIGSGLENDICFLRYSSSVSDVAYQVGPSPTSGVVPIEQGELEAVRTRARKVVAYYVADGASAYSDSGQHGTGVAGVIVADNYGHAVTGGALAGRPVIRDTGRHQNLQTPDRPDGDWSLGDVLRADLSAQVDDPTVAEPQFADNTFGTLVQHHDTRDGVAPAAQLVFTDVGDENGNLSGVFSWQGALRQLSDTGVTAANVSFGNGECTNCYLSAQGVDEALWRHRDLVLTASVGNSGDLGPRTVASGAAQGKNVIGVGASQRGDRAGAGSRPGHDMASFSGIGPASGGRLVPELVAPGGGVVVIATDNNPVSNPEDGTGSGDGNCVGPTTPVTQGTSFSAPAVTGLAILVQQYFRDGFYPSGEPTQEDRLRPTNALVRAVLVNSARNLTGSRTGDDGIVSQDRPTFRQGWGAPVLDDTLYFAGDPTLDDPDGSTERGRLVVLNDVPNGATNLGNFSPEPGGRTRDEIIETMAPAINDAQIQDFPLDVINGDPTSAANDLRITLAWSDAPGQSNTAPTVNDLDLEVVNPNGVIYRPSPFNAWSGGYTQPATEQVEQSFDPLTGLTDFWDRDPANTVENVFVPAADVVEGTWIVRVVGYSVPGSTMGPEPNGTPNFILGDRPLVFDTDGDGVPDVDEYDLLDSRDQGYALIASLGSSEVPPPLFIPVTGPSRAIEAPEPRELPTWEREFGLR